MSDKIAFLFLLFIFISYSSCVTGNLLCVCINFEKNNTFSNSSINKVAMVKNAFLLMSL